MFTQRGVKQLTDFFRTVTAASDLVDCTLVNCIYEIICVHVSTHIQCIVQKEFESFSFSLVSTCILKSKKKARIRFKPPGNILYY